MIGRPPDDCWRETSKREMEREREENYRIRRVRDLLYGRAKQSWPCAVCIVCIVYYVSTFCVIAFTTEMCGDDYYQVYTDKWGASVSHQQETSRTCTWTLLFCIFFYISHGTKQTFYYFSKSSWSCWLFHQSQRWQFSWFYPSPVHHHPFLTSLPHLMLESHHFVLQKYPSDDMQQ
jgi:hypothetical protein